jgi:hypothetical protein
MRTSGGRPFRFTTRLQDFTYRGASYFISICSAERRFFGTVDEYTVRLSPLGRIVEREWLRTPLIRPGVILESPRPPELRARCCAPLHGNGRTFVRRGTGLPPAHEGSARRSRALRALHVLRDSCRLPPSPIPVRIQE